MSDRRCNIDSVADADILKKLRDQVLDESETLSGLLRKTLAVGVATGSEELRTWANNELRGYPDLAPVPEYRQIFVGLLVDSSIGPNSTRGESISLIQVPEEFRQYIPEKVHLRQPVEELAQLASREDSAKMAADGFSVAAALWSQQLQQENMFAKIDALYYKITPQAMSGVVDTVRTTLVEMVFDMTKDVPLDKLPSQAKVDHVVQLHTGANHYEVNIGGSNSGNIGLGSHFSQFQNDSVSAELIDLLARLRAGLFEVEDSDQRAEAEQAIDDFEDAVSEDNPKPEKIKRRWAILERVGTAFGTAVLTEAVKQGAPVVADHLHLMM